MTATTEHATTYEAVLLQDGELELLQIRFAQDADVDDASYLAEVPDGWVLLGHSVDEDDGEVMVFGPRTD